jgi:hypothetical protein
MTAAVSGWIAAAVRTSLSAELRVEHQRLKTVGLLPREAALFKLVPRVVSDRQPRRGLRCNKAEMHQSSKISGQCLAYL